MKPQTKNKISFLLYSYFFLIALFYPMQYVSFDSAYYTEFTFAGLFAGLLILWTVFAYHRPVRLTDPSDRRFCCWILVLLVLYNLFSLYINFTHSRWLWEQFNFSLAVLFFIVLLIHGAAFFLYRGHGFWQRLYGPGCVRIRKLFPQDGTLGCAAVWRGRCVKIPSADNRHRKLLPVLKYASLFHHHSSTVYVCKAQQ